jgi:hypothetical protein
MISSHSNLTDLIVLAVVLPRAINGNIAVEISLEKNLPPLFLDQNQKCLVFIGALSMKMSASKKNTKKYIQYVNKYVINNQLSMISYCSR